MGHVGDEILADTLQALQVGDIMQNRDRARVGRACEPRYLDLEPAAINSRQPQPLLDRVSFFQRSGKHPHHFRIAEDIHQRYALQDRLHVIAGIHADELGKGIVAESDAQAVVNRQDAFHHTRQDRLSPGGFKTQPVYEVTQLRSSSFE